MSSLAVDGRSFSVAGALGGELSTGWGRREEVVGVGVPGGGRERYAWMGEVDHRRVEAVDRPVVGVEWPWPVGHSQAWVGAIAGAGMGGVAQ